MKDVGVFLRNLDVLVLASTSKDDGWGVVVSEALMCGAAAVATDCVGASVVLDAPLLGRVVSAQAPGEIAGSIMDLQQCGAFSSLAKARRAQWSTSILGASGGAEYLLKIISWNQGLAARPEPFYRADAGGVQTGNHSSCAQ
jgi:glycosyltransferase involved in cell wall biosynthesis